MCVFPHRRFTATNTWDLCTSNEKLTLPTCHGLCRWFGALFRTKAWRAPPAAGTGQCGGPAGGVDGRRGDAAGVGPEGAPQGGPRLLSPQRPVGQASRALRLLHRGQGHSGKNTGHGHFYQCSFWKDGPAGFHHTHTHTHARIKHTHTTDTHYTQTYSYTRTCTHVQNTHITYGHTHTHTHHTHTHTPLIRTPHTLTHTHQRHMHTCAKHTHHTHTHSTYIHTTYTHTYTTHRHTHTPPRGAAPSRARREGGRRRGQGGMQGQLEGTDWSPRPARGEGQTGAGVTAGRSRVCGQLCDRVAVLEVAIRSCARDTHRGPSPLW